MRSEQTEWRPLGEPGVTGVLVKVLRYDTATRRAPTMRSMSLEGDIRVGKDHLRKGDNLYTAPNNEHAVRSEGGCVILVNVPQEVERLRYRAHAVVCQARAGRTEGATNRTDYAALKT
jgi:hypothetical protein